jgi:hypothetical protein
LHATFISAVGEYSQVISDASFNVPSALHASPTNLLGSTMAEQRHTLLQGFHESPYWLNFLGFEILTHSPPKFLSLLLFYYLLSLVVWKLGLDSRGPVSILSAGFHVPHCSEELEPDPPYRAPFVVA